LLGSDEVVAALRDRITGLGVIRSEDWIDTSEEDSALDEVARDRASAA
jgi:hypothetical protein